MTTYVVGAGMTPTGRHELETVKSMTASAVALALEDAGVAREAIEAAWFCNTRQGVLEGQHGIRGQVALRAAGFSGLPIFNTDNACASSSSGVMQAFAAVEAGMFDLALVVGAEKMNFPDRRQAMFEAFRGSTDRELLDEHLARLQGSCAAAATTEAAAGERSVFMEIYAAQARLHMELFGTTQRQIAAVAAKNHVHSTRNPLAQYRFPMTVEQVLDDRMVAFPLTRAMCAPMSDGAAALVLASEKAAVRLGKSRAVRILGMGVASGSDRAPEDYSRHLTSAAARRCYDMAGIGPEDVSVAEVHDATAIAEIIQAENLGFCGYGEGGVLAERGISAAGGALPINISGGLLSKGHPVGATGAMQLCELVAQLRGEAEGRQVENASVGLAENGGGFHGVEEAVCVVTMLAAPTRGS